MYFLLQFFEVQNECFFMLKERGSQSQWSSSALYSDLYRTQCIHLESTILHQYDAFDFIQSDHSFSESILEDDGIISDCNHASSMMIDEE